MKISFEENDGILQTDGLPKIVVVNVNGTKFPYQTDKKIVDLYRDIEKIKGVQTVVSEEPAVTSATQSTSGPEVVDVKRNDSAIERGDIVHFTGPVDEQQSTDLFHDYDYRVMTLKGKVAEIVNNVKPQEAIRLTVLRKDIVLVRKGLKPAIQKNMGFEQIERCLCGEDVALKLNQKKNIYEGDCDNCKNHMTSDRGAKAIA